MLGMVLLFLIIAIVAAIFGFGNIVAGAVSIALILFWIFIALFIISLLVSLVRGNRNWWGW